MKLYLFLMVYILFFLNELAAQKNVKYIQPDYKIHTRDSAGTYLQIINYYDRTYYTNQIYLKKVFDNGSFQYIPMAIHKETGIGLIPNSINGKINLQIGKAFEIKDLSFKKDKVNKIEIRSEGGFVSLPLKWGRAQYQRIEGRIINVYDSAAVELTVPFIAELPKGKYVLKLRTIPEIKKIIYLKPSSIFYYPSYTSVPFRIINSQDYGDYKLFFSYYPYNEYKLCSKGSFGKDKFQLYLQPKKLYKIHYRKKGKRRYRKMKFYIDINMDVFNMELK